MLQNYAKKAILLCFLFTSLLINAQNKCTSHQIHQQLESESPAYKVARQEIEKHNNQFKLENNDARAAVTIPVVVHVVWRTGFPSENISDAQILSQIDVLNKDFRRLNTDAANTPTVFQSVAADCGINFCLAQRTPDGKATNGINRVQSSRTTVWGINDEVKNPTLGGVSTWNPSKYLNLYVCNIGGGILGYALFPGAPANLDAVVIDYRYFGTTGTVAPPYHLGRTATHEVGHWLNLSHIWGDATCGNDYVNDTPVHEDANSGCPAYPKVNICSTLPEMTMNYMDYSDDGCMNMFSLGQSQRMNAVLNGGARASLLTSDGCLSPSGVTPTCGVPSNLALSNITSNSANLSWTTVVGASNYTVFYKLSSSTTWLQKIVTTNSALLDGFISGAEYQVNVTANCNGTIGLASPTTVFSTVLTCNPPTLFTATNITSSTATVNWSSTNSAIVQYRKVGTTTWYTASTAINSLNLTGLLSGSTYEVQIVNSCSTTVSSTPLLGQFTTLVASVSCGTVSNISASTITTNSALLNWSLIPGATSYKVSYKTSTALSYTTITATTNTISLTGLAPNISYIVYITTICGGTQSVASQLITFNTLPETCTILPINLAYTNLSPTVGTISWATTFGAASYRLMYKKTTETTWTVISDVKQNSYTLTNLTENTSYEAQVSGVCLNSISGNFTPSLTFKTPLPLPVCADKYESNNNLQSAKVIAINNTINGNIGFAGDQDWFKITNSTNARHLQITLRSIPVDYEVRLYNSSGAVVTTLNSSTATSKQLRYNNGKIGVYYVQVFSSKSAFTTSNCYALKMEANINAYKIATSKENLDFEAENRPMDIIVAPNPMSDEAFVQIFSGIETQMMMTTFDLNGKMIENKHLEIQKNENRIPFSAQNLRNGIYFIRFTYENKIETRKILVQK